MTSTAFPDPSFAGDTESESAHTKPAAAAEKVFELHVSHSDFDHTLYLTNTMTNPLRGPYKPITPKYSYMAGALDRSVPRTLWAAGLKDWETDSVKWRNGPVLGQDPGLEPADHRTMSISVAHRVAQRERRRKEKAIPNVMSGLRALRKERERDPEQRAGQGEG